MLSKCANTNRVLYIDETEDDCFFYVVGLLVDSKSDINHAYNIFKKSIANYPIKQRERVVLFNEFKSTIMDRSYQRIKIKMLECLNGINYSVICAYCKKPMHFHQTDKERTYISLLLSIVKGVQSDIIVIYDAFHKRNFEENIEYFILCEGNVKNITRAESYDEKGLQFADNICSSLRRFFGNSKDIYYQIIKSHTKFICAELH